jgi:hypothetical protein
VPAADLERHHDPVARPKARHGVADVDDLGHELMAERERTEGTRPAMIA